MVALNISGVDRPHLEQLYRSLNTRAQEPALLGSQRLQKLAPDPERLRTLPSQSSDVGPGAADFRRAHRTAHARTAAPGRSGSTDRLSRRGAGPSQGTPLVGHALRRLMAAAAGTAAVPGPGEPQAAARERNPNTRAQTSRTLREALLAP